MRSHIGGAQGQPVADLATLTINVAGVNNQPSFHSTNVTVNESKASTQPYILAGVASKISAGSLLEDVDQQLTFDVQLVANESGYLFAQGGASLPALLPNGTLTFRLAPFVHGSFEMSVVLRDDGGGDFGGVDVSTAQIVHVSILPVNSQPSFALDMPLVTVDECPRADDGFLDDSCCVNE